MKDTNKLFFDIETIKADNYLELMPQEIAKPEPLKFEPFEHRGVKRLKKDTDETYKARQESAFAAYEEKITEQQAEYYLKKEKEKQKWIDDCAKSPLTGQVAMIGYLTELNVYWNMQSESEVLKSFWREYSDYDLVIGFNCKQFDFPFLIKRSWKHKIKIPDGVYQLFKGRFYFSEKIIDLREILSCGEYQAKGKLSDYQRFFGLPVKNDSISKNFEGVWNTDREKAIENNRIEVESIKQIYEIVK